MGRFTYHDDDDHRLPGGMERVGYDADTQRYTFRDSDGTLYESEPGSRYGELRPVGHRYTPEEIEVRNAAVEKNSHEAVRMMLPFVLFLLAFMFLLFKVIDGGFGGGSSVELNDRPAEPVIVCGQGSSQVHIAKGDTCWAMAQKHGLGVDDLLGLEGNEGIDCERLAVGQIICAPE